MTRSSTRATGVFLIQLKALHLLAHYHILHRVCYHFLDKVFYHLPDKDFYHKRGWANFWGLKPRKRGGMALPGAA
jgi:hypothetical protein